MVSHVNSEKVIVGKKVAIESLEKKMKEKGCLN